MSLGPLMADISVYNTESGVISITGPLYVTPPPLENQNFEKRW